jgi:hypothetical protein
MDILSFKGILEVVERGTNTMKKASRNWGIPLFFLRNHLNDRRTSRRIRFGGVLTNEKNVVIVRWVLIMQEVGLPITLQQLKMKMLEFTQTRLAPFYNGIPSASWWYWFKHCHLEINIKQAKRLEVYTTQGLTNSACQMSYTNLQMLYTKHNYITNHIWNFNDTIIQARKQSKIRVLTK